MSRTNNVVSCFTYFDLDDVGYSSFLKDLYYMHGQLQHVAANSHSDAFIYFPNLTWWYHLTRLPDPTYPSEPGWTELDGPEAYESMIRKLLEAPDFIDTTLGLTNNPHYLVSDMSLPYKQYQPATIEGASIEAQEARVYPVYFTLRHTPNVSFPPQSTHTTRPKPSITSTFCDYTSLTSEQLIHFNQGFPPGMSLDSRWSQAPYMVHEPISNQPWSAAPSIFSPNPPSTPTSQRSLSELPSPISRSALQHDQFLNPASSQHIPQQPLHHPLAIASQTSPSFVETPHERAGLFLYTRPAAHLARRYSVPFDTKTTKHGVQVRSDQVKRILSTTVAKPDFDFDRRREEVGSRNMSRSTDCLEFGRAKYVVPNVKVRR